MKKEDLNFKGAAESLDRRTRKQNKVVDSDLSQPKEQQQKTPSKGLLVPKSLLQLDSTTKKSTIELKKSVVIKRLPKAITN